MEVFLEIARNNTNKDLERCGVLGASLKLVQHQPTQYPTSEELSIGKIKFKAFDLGGHQIASQVLLKGESCSSWGCFCFGICIHWGQVVTFRRKVVRMSSDGDRSRGRSKGRSKSPVDRKIRSERQSFCSAPYGETNVGVSWTLYNKSTLLTPASWTFSSSSLYD
ncbi:uncharacterized protein LOC110718694 [Chenopodium quinoa]|uniref:uncharacterized protein LOC110718694 n=1 Tax=Chenopodium quinoa TaxID=63459 RepID=UPI000B77C522|nr:uncharacterized protein LOC110718694 [Chenopodium quinoa]